MAYRNKTYYNLKNQFIRPIFDFIGITEDYDKKTGINILKWIGCDISKTDTNIEYIKVRKKDDPPEFEGRFLAIINEEDDLFKFKKNKEDYEYFNPLTKHKNLTMLMMMMIPVIYERYCAEYDDISYIMSNVVGKNDINISQEKLLKYVNYIKYPTKIVNGEKIYHYGVEIHKDNTDTVKFETISNNKFVVILVLLIKIIDFIDNIEMNNDKYYENFIIETEKLFDKYDKDNKLNVKDLKSSKMFDNNLDLIEIEDIPENNEEILAEEEQEEINHGLLDEIGGYIPHNTDNSYEANNIQWE